MGPEVQSYLALIVVGVAMSGLVWRTVAKRKKPGCGGDCGCASNELKEKIRN